MHCSNVWRSTGNKKHCVACAQEARRDAFARGDAPAPVLSEAELRMAELRQRVAGGLFYCYLPDPGLDDLSETRLRELVLEIGEAEREMHRNFARRAIGGDPSMGWSNGSG